MMLTVAELEAYIEDAEDLLTEAERTGVVTFLAQRPKAGVLIPGTGGVRKLRWGRSGRGKSGGVRVIYYFHSELVPLYLITIFGKGDKENLTKEERNEIAELTKRLAIIWRGKQ